MSTFNTRWRTLSLFNRCFHQTRETLRRHGGRMRKASEHPYQKDSGLNRKDYCKLPLRECRMFLKHHRSRKFAKATLALAICDAISLTSPSLVAKRRRHLKLLLFLTSALLLRSKATPEKPEDTASISRKAQIKLNGRIGWRCQSNGEVGVLLSQSIGCSILITWVSSGRIKHMLTCKHYCLCNTCDQFGRASRVNRIIYGRRRIRWDQDGSRGIQENKEKISFKSNAASMPDLSTWWMQNCWAGTGHDRILWRKENYVGWKSGSHHRIHSCANCGLS